VRLTYRTRYKEPFYKGGKDKERTPGFCDRVLFRSLSPELHQLFQPEMVNVPLHSAAGTPPTHASMHNYNAVNSGECMDISDHSPVYATFVLQVAATPTRDIHGGVATTSAVTMVLRGMRLTWGNRQVAPLGCTAVFPAPYEALAIEQSPGATSSLVSTSARRSPAADAPSTRRSVASARQTPGAPPLPPLASVIMNVPIDATAPDSGSRVRWQAKDSSQSSVRCVSTSYMTPGSLSMQSLTRHQVARGPLDTSDVTAALPPLPLRWMGTESDAPLADLHLLLRIEYCDQLTEPHGHSAAPHAPQAHAQVSSVRREDIKEGQCAIAIGPLVREWEQNSSHGAPMVKMVSQQLCWHGLPVTIESAAQACPLFVTFNLHMSNAAADAT